MSKKVYEHPTLNIDKVYAANTFFNGSSEEISDIFSANGIDKKAKEMFDLRDLKNIQNFISCITRLEENPDMKINDLINNNMLTTNLGLILCSGFLTIKEERINRIFLNDLDQIPGIYNMIHIKRPIFSSEKGKEINPFNKLGWKKIIQKIRNSLAHHNYSMHQNGIYINNPKEDFEAFIDYTFFSSILGWAPLFDRKPNLFFIHKYDDINFNEGFEANKDLIKAEYIKKVKKDNNLHSLRPQHKYVYEFLMNKEISDNSGDFKYFNGHIPISNRLYYIFSKFFSTHTFDEYYLDILLKQESNIKMGTMEYNFLCGVAEAIEIWIENQNITYKELKSFFICTLIEDVESARGEIPINIKNSLVNSILSNDIKTFDNTINIFRKARRLRVIEDENKIDGQTKSELIKLISSDTINVKNINEGKDLLNVMRVTYIKNYKHLDKENKEKIISNISSIDVDSKNFFNLFKDTHIDIQNLSIIVCDFFCKLCLFQSLEFNANLGFLLQHINAWRNFNIDLLPSYLKVLYVMKRYINNPLLKTAKKGEDILEEEHIRNAFAHHNFYILPGVNEILLQDPSQNDKPDWEKIYNLNNLYQTCVKNSELHFNQDLGKTSK